MTPQLAAACAASLLVVSSLGLWLDRARRGGWLEMTTLLPMLPLVALVTGFWTPGPAAVALVAALVVALLSRSRDDVLHSECALKLMWVLGPALAVSFAAVALLLVLSVTILARGGASGLSATPFHWPSGGAGHDVLLAFGLAVLAFGGFEAAAPLAEETRDPRRNVPIAVLGAVVVSGIIYVVGSYALVTAFGVGHAGALAADGNPFHTAANAFIPFVAPLITWIFLSSVTSSYVAANTQTSRVIFAGARGGLWSHALAGVSPRFKTPAAAAIAFVAPSILIGVVSTAFTDPGTASGFLGVYGILGLIIMYLVANVALVVEWAKFRSQGIRKNAWLWVVTPVIGVAVLAIPIWGDLRPGQPSPFNALPWLTLALIAVGVIYPFALNALRPHALERAPALLEGDEAAAVDPLPITD
jgi:amino acid transporter